MSDLTTTRTSRRPPKPPPAAAKSPKEANRNKDLSRIHILKKELGLDEDNYRALLKGLTGKDSAGLLDAKERWRVLCEMGKLLNGGKEPPKKKGKHPGRPARPMGQGRDALIGKMEAHLAEAKRPWSYANSMAKHMFGVDLVQWLDADQLWRLVAALEYDQKRRETRAAAEVAQ